MQYVGEMIGLTLSGYGLWFAVRGIKMYLSTDKAWWRPINRQNRYPYPVAGVLLGVFFVLAGLVFLLHNVWPQSVVLGYIGGGLFVLVFIIGIAQPRLLHPRWYGLLEDQLGRPALDRLKKLAQAMEPEEWDEVNASHDAFVQWATQKTLPYQPKKARGYKKQR